MAAKAKKKKSIKLTPVLIVKYLLVGAVGLVLIAATIARVFHYFNHHLK